MATVEGVALDILNAAAILKRLPRTGWLLAGVPLPESVAAHTYAMSLLALVIAELINADPAANGLGCPLDGGRVAQIALVHDLAESAVTDLPHRTTRLLGKEVKHRAEEQALHELCAPFPDPEHLLGLWREYDQQSTPEARLVRDADKLEMVHQALEYEFSGQRNLGDFWEGHSWHYGVCAQIFAALQQARVR